MRKFIHLFTPVWFIQAQHKSYTCSNVLSYKYHQNILSFWFCFDMAWNLLNWQQHTDANLCVICYKKWVPEKTLLNFIDTCQELRTLLLQLFDYYFIQYQFSYRLYCWSYVTYIYFYKFFNTKKRKHTGISEFSWVLWTLDITQLFP